MVDNMKIMKAIGKLKNKYDNLPLNHQINLIIGFIILIAIFFISSISYVKTLNYTKKNFEENGTIIVQETQDKINSKLNLVENTVSLISKDARIQNYNVPGVNINEGEITAYLNNCIEFNKYDVHEDGLIYINNIIDDLIFIADQNPIIARRIHFTVYNISKYLNNEWFKAAEQDSGRLIWTKPFYNGSAEDILKPNSREVESQLNQFMLIKHIKSDKNHQEIGFVCASINFENLCRLIDNIKFGQEGAMYVIDDKGTIIASHNRKDLFNHINFDSEASEKISNSLDNEVYLNGTIGGREYLIFHAPLSINNWKIVMTIPVSELKQSISGTLLSIVIIGIMFFLIIITISSLILNNLSYPLKQIVYSIKKAPEKSFTEKINVEGCIEVRELSQQYNYMMDKINELLNRIVDEEKAIVKTELKALRAQINPHFLYNTLDSIKWLVISSDIERATELTTALSTFFRIGLSGGSEEIPIREEVEHVRQYLFIQKMRYGDRLDYLIDVDSSLEPLRTPKLILQPVIENAIYHGLNKKEGNGFIRLKIKSEDNNAIIYEVVDNGAGMSPEALEELTKKINEPIPLNTSDRNGFAIRNVNQRLKLSYGEQFGIFYTSKAGVGTKVTIRLPKL